MNRWQQRLAELHGDTGEQRSAPQPAVQNVQNVQNPFFAPTSEHFEPIEQPKEKTKASTAPACGETEEERVAIVEHDGGIPREWVEGFAQLDPDRPAISSVDTAAPAEIAGRTIQDADRCDDPEFWRELYEERAAIRQYDGGYRRDEAERLAWGELQNRWHMARGERVSRELCAGCRRPIGNAEALDMIDGNRVHLATLDCLIRRGDRWRRAGTAALVAMGLNPPLERSDTIG